MPWNFGKRNGELKFLKDPHILAAAIEENRRVLTPLWLELLEEGQKDESI